MANIKVLQGISRVFRFIGWLLEIYFYSGLNMYRPVQTITEGHRVALKFYLIL